MGLIKALVVNKVVDVATDAVMSKSASRGIKAQKKTEEKIEKAKSQRKNIHGAFEKGISKDVFLEIVSACAQREGITDISVNRTRITVKAKKGIKHKEYIIDYNDYGSITGKYWLNDEKTQVLKCFE